MSLFLCVILSEVRARSDRTQSKDPYCGYGPSGHSPSSLRHSVIPSPQTRACFERARLKCVRENPVAAPRLGKIFHFTRGLRPGLTSLPPLRGWIQSIPASLSHRKLFLRVLTQTLKSCPDTRRSKPISRDPWNRVLSRLGLDRSRALPLSRHGCEQVGLHQRPEALIIGREVHLHQVFGAVDSGVLQRQLLARRAAHPAVEDARFH